MTKNNQYKLKPLYKMDASNDWKIVVPDPFLNCTKIHPLQQKYVTEFLDSVDKNKQIKTVFIFGSSVTDQCGCDSDLDIYLELDDNKKLNFPLFTFDCDIWTNYTVDDNLLEEIMGKGVKVYGQDAF